jgi:hypothetical protein
MTPASPLLPLSSEAHWALARARLVSLSHHLQPRWTTGYMTQAQTLVV